MSVIPGSGLTGGNGGNGAFGSDGGAGGGGVGVLSTTEIEIELDSLIKLP